MEKRARYRRNENRSAILKPRVFGFEFSKENHFALSCLKADLPYRRTWEVRRYFYAQSETIPLVPLDKEIISRIFDNTKPMFSQPRLDWRAFRNLDDVKKRGIGFEFLRFQTRQFEHFDKRRYSNASLDQKRGQVRTICKLLKLRFALLGGSVLCRGQNPVGD